MSNPVICDERRLERMRSYHDDPTREALSCALALIEDLKECGAWDKYRQDWAVANSDANDDPCKDSDTDSCNSDVTAWDSDILRYSKLW